MALGSDIIKRILVKFEGGDSGAAKAIDTIALETKEATQEFSQLKSAAQQAMDTIGLGAAEAGPLNNFGFTFQKVTGRIGDGIKAIDGFAKTLGPWNQALELGGKVVGFASDAMDVYAKTNAQAAKEVAALKTEFAGYRDTVMASAGKMAVELLKPAASIEAQWKELLKLQNLPIYQRFFDPSGKLRDLKPSDFTKEELDLAARFGVRFVERARTPLAILQDATEKALGSVRAELHKTNDAWNTDGEQFVQNLVKGFGAAAKTSSKAAAELARVRAELLAQQREARDILGSSTTEFDFDSTARPGVLGMRAAEASDTRAVLDRVNTERFKSQLPGFGKGWLDAETQALQKFSDLAASAYDQIVSGSASAAQAFTGLAKQQLIAFGLKEAAEAVSQVGYGFGALANPLFAGAAAMHFTSAAKHAAAAGLAGVAVAGIGALGGGGGGGSAAAAGGASAVGGGAGGGVTRTQTITNYIIVGDSHADDSPRMEQNNLRRRAALAEGRTSASRAE